MPRLKYILYNASYLWNYYTIIISVDGFTTLTSGFSLTPRYDLVHVCIISSEDNLLI
jgi:hypothetical protein